MPKRTVGNNDGYDEKNRETCKWDSQTNGCDTDLECNQYGMTCMAQCISKGGLPCSKNGWPLKLHLDDSNNIRDYAKDILNQCEALKQKHQTAVRILEAIQYEWCLCTQHGTLLATRFKTINDVADIYKCNQEFIAKPKHTLTTIITKACGKQMKTLDILLSFLTNICQAPSKRQCYIVFKIGSKEMKLSSILTKVKRLKTQNTPKQLCAFIEKAYWKVALMDMEVATLLSNNVTNDYIQKEDNETAFLVFPFWSTETDHWLYHRTSFTRESKKMVRLVESLLGTSIKQSKERTSIPLFDSPIPIVDLNFNECSTADEYPVSFGTLRMASHDLLVHGSPVLFNDSENYELKGDEARLSDRVNIPFFWAVKQNNIGYLYFYSLKEEYVEKYSGLPNVIFLCGAKYLTKYNTLVKKLTDFGKLSKDGRKNIGADDLVLGHICHQNINALLMPDYERQIMVCLDGKFLQIACVLKVQKREVEKHQYIKEVTDIIYVRNDAIRNTVEDLLEEANVVINL